MMKIIMSELNYVYILVVYYMFYNTTSVALVLILTNNSI